MDDRGDPADKYVEFQLTDFQSLWDNVTDDDIVRTLELMEQDLMKTEGEVTLAPVASATPSAVSPVPAPTAAPIKAGSKRRFASVTENELSRIEMERHEKKTMDTTAWAVRLLKEWCKSKDKDENFEHLPSDVLCLLLRQFYGEVRKENGQAYSKSSLCNIRAALQRHISSPPFNRTINIIRNEQFQAANNVFDGTLKRMKRDGKDTATHYPPISNEDLQKLFSGSVLSSKDPASLQRWVFFSVQYLFCRRGREGLRQLKKDAFEIKEDATGLEYVTMTYNEHEKNHPGTLNESYLQDKRLYATGDNHCPVKAFRLYMSKLHPACDFFYQRPKKTVTSKSPIWYDNVPLGHNTIGNLMRDISKAAGLSQVYTNHSIRATSIVALNDAGFSDRIICSLSGHRNTSSLRSYCSDASDGQKRSMSDVLSRRCTTKPHTESTPPERINSTKMQQVEIQPLGLPHPLPSRPINSMMPSESPSNSILDSSLAQQATKSAGTNRPKPQTTSASTCTTVCSPARISPPLPTNSTSLAVQVQQPSTSSRPSTECMGNMIPSHLFTGCNFDGATVNFYFGSGH